MTSDRLAIATCTEHLEAFGLEVGVTTPEGVGGAPSADRVSGRDAVAVHGALGSVVCEIQRAEPHLDTGTEDDDMLAQAISGLMSVHGRDDGRPRRLGLEVVSAAAGVLAAQAVLATLVARARGLFLAEASTSILGAGLLYLTHHLAMITSDEPWAPPPAGPAVCPPFPTVDDGWVEVEMITPDSWHAFWRALGVRDPRLGIAWLTFASRHATGRCRLPEALPAATRRRTVEELRAVAETAGAVVCPLRSCADLIADLPSGDARARTAGWARPWSLRPGFEHERPRSAGGPASRPGPPLPLAGMRVVEATTRVQGPLAGQLLRMLGAEVFRLEPPGGDVARIVPPRAGSESAAFLAYNRDKVPVEVDYKAAGGRDTILDLVRDADVFLHSWRQGRATELGLDWDDMARVNPRLVFAHASGWGPRRESAPSAAARPGGGAIATDFLVQAHAALGDVLSPDGEPPFPSRVTLVDVLGGLIACEGALAALHLRERDGRGRRVDTSLLAAGLMLQAPVVDGILTGCERGRRAGRPVWGKLDHPLPAGDGHIALAAGTPERAAALTRVVGGGTRAGALTERLRARSAAEWEPLLRDAGLPAAAVRDDIAALRRDPRLTGMLEHLEQGCWVPAAPWRFGPPAAPSS